ncbi:unnamed protein product [Meloidogyne enterolobii]|uniref:Uncharacterized protein n=1 Tax=Meloidogyne enterolobii TaxID=390850 RepID=A0ACB0Z8G8_MELEN
MCEKERGQPIFLFIDLECLHHFYQYNTLLCGITCYACCLSSITINYFHFWRPTLRLLLLHLSLQAPTQLGNFSLFFSHFTTMTFQIITAFDFSYDVLFLFIYILSASAGLHN